MKWRIKRARRRIEECIYYICIFFKYMFVIIQERIGHLARRNSADGGCMLHAARLVILFFFIFWNIFSFLSVPIFCFIYFLYYRLFVCNYIFVLLFDVACNIKISNLIYLSECRVLAFSEEKILILWFIFLSYV